VLLPLVVLLESIASVALVSAGLVIDAAVDSERNSDVCRICNFPE
jgi:hypothetical protein